MTIAALVAKSPLRLGSKGDDVLALQHALRAHGHQLVPDKDFGSITELAVRRFQGAHGLDPDGVVGPMTAVKLDEKNEVPSEIEQPLPSSLKIAPWLSVARATTGTKEISGRLSNPEIIRWRDEILRRFPDLKPNLNWYVNDDTPWCGLHEAFCVASSGYKPPVAPLLAANWFYKWDDGVRLKRPALGAILVKTRAGGGHVTNYEGEDENFFYGRGGNQSDMVNVSKVKKNSEVLGFMWPAGHPLPTGGPVRISFADAVAGSEA